MILALLLALQQAGPLTVGDTIWLSRTVPVPPGGEVRPAVWEPAGDLGLLGPPVVRREGNRATVAYPAVAWRAGRHQIAVPGPVIIRSDGGTDSLAAQSFAVEVASVLPADTPPQELPVQPGAGLVSQRITTPWPLVTLLLGAALLFAPAVWWWRRRGPPLPPLPALPSGPAVPLAEWSEAGEHRAVAAAAARHLRQTITGLLPGVPQGSLATRLVRVVAEQRPAWPVEEIGTVLRALEAAQFAEAPATEVVSLAARAEALKSRLGATPVRGGEAS